MTPIPRTRSSGSRCRAGAVGAGLLVLLAGCASSDRIARQDVQTLEVDVQQMGSTLQARQTSLNEQVRELREEQARLQSQIEENRRSAKIVGQHLEESRLQTREDFEQRDRALEKSDQRAAQQDARLQNQIEQLGKSLQTVNDNLQTIGDFEKKQEERIAKIQENFQAQLTVVVDEVGQENRRLQGDLQALRSDLQAEQAGLDGLQKAMQQLADALAETQGQLQEIARQQDALRRSVAEAAAAAAAAKKAAAEPRSTDVHTVQAGETLTGIAARYGVSLQAIMERNAIENPNDLRQGQKLTIPRP